MILIKHNGHLHVFNFEEVVDSYIWNPFNKTIKRLQNNKPFQALKLIATTQESTPELNFGDEMPSIDLTQMVKYQLCQQPEECDGSLTKKCICPSRMVKLHDFLTGSYNIDTEAISQANGYPPEQHTGFTNGYKLAVSHKADKRFTLKDMERCYSMGITFSCATNNNVDNSNYTFSKLIEKLDKTKTKWHIEVEMIKSSLQYCNSSSSELVVKITDGFINILKIKEQCEVK